jgi:hypothetical protein
MEVLADVSRSEASAPSQRMGPWFAQPGQFTVTGTVEGTSLVDATAPVTTATDAGSGQ